MSNLQKPSFAMVINSEGYKRLMNTALGDPKRVQRFVSAITSAVAVNPALQECDASTILSGALLGESLNLSPSPQLGQYYLVPFNSKIGTDEKGTPIYTKKAQFQLGYKGYIQLAIRSGNYKKINVFAVKQGELVSFDPIFEEISIKPIEDEDEREKAPTVGYCATFEYMNGFRKTLYWTKKKMIAHADKYSQAFSATATTMNSKGKSYKKVSFEDYEAGKYPPKDEWMYSSFWYKDFDGMACKTMLRQLISKWGIMSIEMQDVFTKDMGVINEDGSVDYIEADTDEVIIPQGEPVEEEDVSAEEPVRLDEI